MRYAAHRHSGVSAIHDSNQKRLKGMPKSMGSIRSQSGTEKHKAPKGTRPQRSAPRDGFLAGVAGIMTAQSETDTPVSSASSCIPVSLFRIHENGSDLNTSIGLRRY